MFRTIGNTWQITKLSWKVLQLDRELIFFPIMGALGAIVGGVIAAGFFAGVGRRHGASRGLGVVHGGRRPPGGEGHALPAGVVLEHGAEGRVLCHRRPADSDQLADLRQMESPSVHGQGLAGRLARVDLFAQAQHRLPAAFRAAAPAHASRSL